MASTSLLNASTPRPGAPEEGRGLSHLAFARLLDWLDDGVDSHGETYLEMRRRLVSYFDRRNRRAADELADETLNRIARTLENDGAIAVTPQARYCYVVARFVLLEDVRRERVHPIQAPRHLAAGAWEGRGTTLAPTDESLGNREESLERLDRCLQEMNPEHRALIVEYYRDAGGKKIARRRDLARRLGITMNALGLRAARIRAAVESRMAVGGGQW